MRSHYLRKQKFVQNALDYYTFGDKINLTTGVFANLATVTYTNILGEGNHSPLPLLSPPPVIEVRFLCITA